MFLKAWFSIGLELEHLLHLRMRMGLDNGPLMGIKPEVNETE